MRTVSIKKSNSSSTIHHPMCSFPRPRLAATIFLLLISSITQLLHNSPSIPGVSAQRITSSAHTYEVKVGGSVELPCVFEGVDDVEERVVVWKRSDGAVLAVDEDVHVSDNRISVRSDGEKSYTLRIASLEPYDSADYTCSVTSRPPLEVTHRLLIDVPPTAKLSSVSPLHVRAGEEVLVRCSASGNPPPILKWRRVSEAGAQLPLPPGSTAHEGRLRIERVGEDDSGTYECHASNGVGPDSTAELDLRVRGANGNGGSSGILPASGSMTYNEAMESAPWVDTDRTYMPARIGADVNLTCRYGGNPIPDADWFFSGFLINRRADAKFKSHAMVYGTTLGNHSVTIFSLKDLHEDHFGDYTCKVGNVLGHAERIIHLSGRPGPPTLTIRNGRIHWTVESVSPVTDYKLLYRETDEDMWNNFKELKSTRADQHGDVWEHNVPLNFLKPDTVYELQLQAKNSLGYGSLARNFITYDPHEGSGKRRKDAIGAAMDQKAGGDRPTFATAILLLLLVLFSGAPLM